MTMRNTEAVILSGASAKSKDPIGRKIGGVPNGTPPLLWVFSVHDQALARHLGGLFEAHQIEQRRAQVAQFPAYLAQLVLRMLGVDPILPTHSSTVRTAFFAASMTPVWPTMSQLAKFSMMTSYFSSSMHLITASVTS